MPGLILVYATAAMDFLEDEIAKLKRKTAPAAGPADAPQAQRYIRRAEVVAGQRTEYLAEQARRSEAREAARRAPEDEKKVEVQRRTASLQASWRGTKPVGVMMQAAVAPVTSKDKVCVPAHRASSAKRPAEVPDVTAAADHDTAVALRTKRQKLTLDNVYTFPPDASLPIDRDHAGLAQLPPQSQVALNASWARDDAEIERLCQSCFTLLRSAICIWQLDLSSTPPTAAGRERDEGVLYSTTRSDLAPLLHKLRRKALPRDVLCKLAQLLIGLRSNDTLAAGQAHLSLSIGNHAWPTRGNIGVGIHERARPKFEERRERSRLAAIEAAKLASHRAAEQRRKNGGDHGEYGNGDDDDNEEDDDEAWKLQGDAGQAYMLADDTTRRWLQGLRRLITHFERRAA